MTRGDKLEKKKNGKIGPIRMCDQLIANFEPLICIFFSLFFKKTNGAILNESEPLFVASNGKKYVKKGCFR